MDVAEVSYIELDFPSFRLPRAFTVARRVRNDRGRKSNGMQPLPISSAHRSGGHRIMTVPARSDIAATEVHKLEPTVIVSLEYLSIISTGCPTDDYMVRFDAQYLSLRCTIRM